MGPIWFGGTHVDFNQSKRVCYKVLLKNVLLAFLSTLNLSTSNVTFVKWFSGGYNFHYLYYLLASGLKYSFFFHWSKFCLSLLMVAICWGDISLLVNFILLYLFIILLWVWVLSLTIYYRGSNSNLLNIFSLYIGGLKM